MIGMDKRKIRDQKVNQLKQGSSAYAESNELIRLIKRGIEKENLHVLYEHTEAGCWFTPLSENNQS